MSWYQNQPQTTFRNILHQTNISQSHPNVNVCWNGQSYASNYTNNRPERYCFDQIESREYYFQQRQQIFNYNSNYSDVLHEHNTCDTYSQECSANFPTDNDCINTSFAPTIYQSMYYVPNNCTSSAQQNNVENSDPNFCSVFNHQALRDYYSCSEYSNCIEPGEKWENIG